MLRKVILSIETPLEELNITALGGISQVTPGTGGLSAFPVALC